MELHSNLQAKRVDKRMTRPQLAEKAGVSWETIKAYETKGALPSLPVALRLAEALECNVEDIFSHILPSGEDEGVTVE